MGTNGRTDDDIDLLIDLMQRGFTREKARQNGHEFSNAQWSLARKIYKQEETI
jgi:hypothetical protein